jgi:D-amino-acid dehydrogenase
VSSDLLKSVASAAGSTAAAGLWFPNSGHVLDPLAICQALARSAVVHGATLERCEVRSLQASGDRIEVVTESRRRVVSTAIVCAGAWSQPLLAPFGLRAPLEAARGYHVELPGHAAVVDAPIVYVDQSVLVTPMASRLRASAYMEFAGLNAPPDPRKPARLREKLKHLGYRCEETGPSWVGARPVLPDYLPGIGRAPGPCRLFYAVGHQHIGLTLAPVTAELIADLVADRVPRHDVQPFDLRRFG